MTVVTLPSRPALDLSPAPRTRPPLTAILPGCTPADPPPAWTPSAPDVDTEIPEPTDADPAMARPARLAALAVTETLTGRRPLAQTRHLFDPRVGYLLEHLVRARCALGGRMSGLRVQCPTEGMAEAMLLLHTPERTGAVALRVERRDHRWAVTALEAALGPEVQYPARA